MIHENDCQNRREEITALVLGELEPKATQELDKVAAEPYRIEGTRHGVCKPEHPACQKAQEGGHSSLYKGVAPSCLRDGRGQLGVAECGEGGDNTVECKGHDSSRARFRVTLAVASSTVRSTRPR